MLKKKIYNGEIWLEDGSKHFSVLEKLDNGKLKLKTNLGVPEYDQQTVDIIYGVFIGLGHLTFIGNYLTQHSSGLSNYYEYLVKYCFISTDYYVNIKDLEIKSASFYNDTIAKLDRKVGFIDLFTNTYNRTGDRNKIPQFV
ncbi:ApeA N-terminal domain 1-containing protein [Psychroflexus sp. MBR-150]|jgi:hypothetical protein